MLFLSRLSQPHSRFILRRPRAFSLGRFIGDPATSRKQTSHVESLPEIGGAGMAHLCRQEVAFQGLPARICWLGYRERDRQGCFNQMYEMANSVPNRDRRDHLDAVLCKPVP